MAALFWTYDMVSPPNVEPLVWEAQNAYGTWERVPLNVRLVKV